MKDPAFAAEFQRRVGFRRLLAFYLRHRARLAALLRSAAQNAFRLRQTYLGNFPASSGGEPRQWSRAFGAWSAAKARLGPRGPWLVPLFLLANLAIALGVCRASADPSHRSLGAGVAVLAAMAIGEFLVCSLGDALADVARHLHSFNVMTDLLLVGDATWIVSVAAASFRPAAPPGLKPATS